MHLSSPSADTSAKRVWLVLLEDLFKQDKALAILIKLHFELLELRKLCGFVFWWRGVDLTVVPRRSGVLPCCRGLTAGSVVLCFVGGFHRPVDIEAFPSRVIAVRFRVGVWLGGVEASTSLLQ